MRLILKLAVLSQGFESLKEVQMPEVTIEMMCQLMRQHKMPDGHRPGPDRDNRSPTPPWIK